MPGRGLYISTTSYPLPGETGPGASLEQFDATPGYFEVMGARLIAGRLFDPARPADLNPSKEGDDASENRLANIVINRSAVRVFHFASPQAAIGKVVGVERPRTIIGVIEDMRVASHRHRLGSVLSRDLEPRE